MKIVFGDVKAEGMRRGDGACCSYTTDGVAMVISREYIIAYATTAYNLSGLFKGSLTHLRMYVVLF
jgi:hypothetical protein